jgi:hypothetical protein
MRIVKDAEERKNEILDAADELFCLKGYDHTTTNDILEKVGIAREGCITTSSPRKILWMLLLSDIKSVF